MPPLSEAPVKARPTVYFIDDSATMREVIKIAFRRENINVITCADAASALAQFEQNRPDVVITDVIMPDQDGYSVCSQIKQHPEFGEIPVVLMSGVVNKSVADKAVSVKADELIRKPFQPQELIGRVKTLLAPKEAAAPGAARTHQLPGAAKSVRTAACPGSNCRRLPNQFRAQLQRCSVIPGRTGVAARTGGSLYAVAAATFSQLRGNSTQPSSAALGSAAHLASSKRTASPVIFRDDPNFAGKSRDWNCWLRNCRTNCNSSANTLRLWNNRFAHLLPRIEFSAAKK